MSDYDDALEMTNELQDELRSMDEIADMASSNNFIARSLRFIANGLKVVLSVAVNVVKFIPVTVATVIAGRGSTAAGREKSEDKQADKKEKKAAEKEKDEGKAAPEAKPKEKEQKEPVIKEGKLTAEQLYAFSKGGVVHELFKYYGITLSVDSEKGRVSFNAEQPSEVAGKSGVMQRLGTMDMKDLFSPDGPAEDIALILNKRHKMLETVTKEPISADEMRIRSFIGAALIKTFATYNGTARDRNAALDKGEAFTIASLKAPGLNGTERIVVTTDESVLNRLNITMNGSKVMHLDLADIMSGKDNLHISDVEKKLIDSYKEGLEGAVTLQTEAGEFHFTRFYDNPAILEVHHNDEMIGRFETVSEQDCLKVADAVGESVKAELEKNGAVYDGTVTIETDNGQKTVSPEAVGYAAVHMFAMQEVNDRTGTGKDAYIDPLNRTKAQAGSPHITLSKCIEKDADRIVITAYTPDKNLFGSEKMTVTSEYMGYGLKEMMIRSDPGKEIPELKGKGFGDLIAVVENVKQVHADVKFTVPDYERKTPENYEYRNKEQFEAISKGRLIYEHRSGMPEKGDEEMQADREGPAVTFTVPDWARPDREEPSYDDGMEEDRDDPEEEYDESLEDDYMPDEVPMSENDKGIDTRDEEAFLEEYGDDWDAMEH